MMMQQLAVIMLIVMLLVLVVSIDGIATASRLGHSHSEKKHFPSSASLTARTSSRDLDVGLEYPSDFLFHRRDRDQHKVTPHSYVSQDFFSRDSRLSFIRKVYAIFTSQIATTILVTYILMNNQALASIALRNIDMISIISFLTCLATVVPLVSSPQLRSTPPLNFLLLGIYTLMQSVMVGTFSTMVSPEAVCLGSMHTLSAFVAITLYSFQPNQQLDLTPFGSALLSCLTSLLTGVTLTSFFGISMSDNLVSAAFAALFAAYIAHDTQKIVGGRHHKHAYSPKDYILASLNLYQDVIGFFMEVVKILNKQQRRQQSDNKSNR